MDVPVTERQFLEQLHELSHKIKFVKEQSFHDAIACQDVQEVLEKLRTKVRRATVIDTDSSLALL
jgi:vacuolar protein sorting-associated protein 52